MCVPKFYLIHIYVKVCVEITYLSNCAHLNHVSIDVRVFESHVYTPKRTHAHIYIFVYTHVRIWCRNLVDITYM